MSESVTTDQQDQQEADRVLHNAELMALLVDWLFIGRETDPPKGPPRLERLETATRARAMGTARG